MNYADALFLLALGWFMYAYYKEKAEHTKTKNDLAILKRMGELTELGQKLEDERKDYDEALANHTNHLVPDHMLSRLGAEFPEPTNEDNVSSGEVLSPAPAGEPKFFKGKAAEDIREGQAVEIHVLPEIGQTIVQGTAPTTRIPPTES